MEEWTVVSVIVVLIGLFFTVGKPVLNLNTTLVRLEEKLNGVTAKIDVFERHNDAEHTHINNTLERHEDTLEEHTIRLNKLEK